MHTLKGKPLSLGYSAGRAFLYDGGHLQIPRYYIAPSQIETEIERVERAIGRARVEIECLRERLISEYGHSEAEIFAAHRMFLDDPQFAGDIEKRVRVQRVNAECAVQEIVAELALVLQEAAQSHLRQRDMDLRDLGRRLQRQLLRVQGAPRGRLPAGSIIVARELLPSDVLELDRASVTGLVTEVGGEASHAAILARALGIAAVTAVRNATRALKNGQQVLVDGERGGVVVDPDRATLQRFLRLKEDFERDISVTSAREGRRCVTEDGVRIRIYGNIGRPEDAAEVARHNLDGVGLFRTEYLFLDRAEPPGIDGQRAAYERAAVLLGARPLVIRTLDFGGDKRPVFVRTQFEANPSLGMRGLRFSLAMAMELFRNQLRAVLRVARDHDVRVLFPMVLGASDLDRALRLLHATADELGVRELPPVGALVETPSAVFAMNEILARVDFVSIGTNDLTQFVLAADRNAVALMDDYTVLHPSVLRAIHAVAAAAAAAARPVSVCGEAASDPRVARLLVGLGIRELSMSPVAAARVRYALRHARCDELHRLAASALACETPNEVRALVAESADTRPETFRIAQPDRATNA